MANGDRTQAPTRRRREEARRQGQLAYSHDLNTGVLLVVAALVVWLGGRAIGIQLLEAVRAELHLFGGPDLSPQDVQAHFAAVFRQGLAVAGLLLGLLLVASLAAGVLQAGFHLNAGLLTVHWERVSPVDNYGRVFSWTSAMRGLIAVLKIVAVGGVAYLLMRGRLDELTSLSEGTLAGATARAWELVVRVALAAAATLFLIGVIDYVYQRIRFERSLRMTRQEVKDETKREEGDPQVKARIRKLQRQAAQRRMLKEVPRATVVITNPTHLAVALRYDRATMAAPRVVAKGAGFIAERIVKLARSHGVPVVQRPPLAQALYRTVQPDQEVPAALYLVVAEVLAYVYRLRGGPPQDMTPRARVVRPGA